MNQNTLHYIELKTGYTDNGPAWIGQIEFSKSRRTIYFNGKAFQSSQGSGILGNYWDIETREEYWISGVKKNGKDRLHSISGKVQIDRNVVSEYLKIINRDSLSTSQFEIVDVLPTNKQRFTELINQKM